MFTDLRLARCAFVVGAALAWCACNSNPSTPSSSALAGTWGGDHIRLTVADTSSDLEFDCAHGEIPGRLMANGRNEFNVAGTFVRDHGGPIRVGDPPDFHPAAYVGLVTTTTMTMTVRLTDTNEVVGSFTLLRGTPGRVVKCLLPLVYGLEGR